MDSEALQDLFQDLGPVRIRKMFGGQSVYFDDRIFAIEISGEVYIKADADNLPHFQKAGSRPFTYEKDGKAIPMSYWLMPEAAFDDPSEAAQWARLGLEAAGRAASSKTKKRKKTA